MLSASPSCRARALPLVSLVVLFLMASLPSIVSADPGDLLTTFGAGGISFEGLEQNHQVQDAILHPSLGLLVATFENQVPEARLRLVQIDPETGIALGTVTYPHLMDEEQGLHLEDDGHGGVIVGATVVATGNDLDALIFRITPGLAIDPGFGLVQVPFNLDPANPIDAVRDLEVLSDGRIVALVEAWSTFGIQAGLVFLNPDGTFDATLPNGPLPDGIEYVWYDQESVLPVAMAEDSLGRLWALSARSGLSTNTIAVARLRSSDGRPDTTFAGEGFAFLEYRDCVLCPVEDSDPEDLAVLGDRAYVVVSTRDDTDTYTIPAVARLSDSGGVDPFFGIWRSVDFTAPGGGAVDSTWPDLEADPVGNRVVLTANATSLVDGQTYVGIARLGLDGENDPHFGSGAPVVHSFGPGTQFFRTQLAVQGVEEISGTFSSLRIAVTEDVAQDVAVMAIEGFDVSIFADDFESGDLSAWSVVSP